MVTICSFFKITISFTFVIVSECVMTDYRTSQVLGITLTLGMVCWVHCPGKLVGKSRKCPLMAMKKMTFRSA